MTTIHICSLKMVESLAAEIKPSHVLSLLGGFSPFPPTPVGVKPSNHLKLTLSDIAEPQEGMITPEASHVDQILAFGRHWGTHSGGTSPILIHCFAGISRSTASALMIACALRPKVSEAVFAEALRAASESAQPNPLLISHADAALQRDGRMIGAVDAIGFGDLTKAGTPFMLALDPA